MKLLRRIANLGYGSRRQVLALFREGRITDVAGRVLAPDDRPDHEQVRIDGQALDPAPGMLIALNKPAGYTCSRRDAARLVYELLPPRFLLRKPLLSSIGRLDRETTGLLLFTDDGQLLHRIIAPRSRVPKTYAVELAEDLRGHEAELFASGKLVLEAETTPLAPARLEVLGARQARLTVIEGRYHQVRRMFAATGNAVVALHRASIGALQLGALGLEPGAWRLLDEGEQRRLWAVA